MIDDLKTELQRTGFTLRKLALHIAETDRSLLPPDLLSLMLSECPLPTVAAHAADLIAVLRAVPDAPKSSKDRYTKRDTIRRMVVTDEMRAELNEHLIRTNTSVLGLCRILFPRENPATIAASVRHAKNGTQTTLPLHIWNRVIEYLRAIDEKAALPVSAGSEAVVVVPGAQAYPKKTASISERRKGGSKPDLDPSSIPAAIPRPGIAEYKLTKRRKDMGYVVIDDALYDALHAERRRTCVSSGRLLVSAPNPPPDLRDYQIAQWFSGAAKSAERHHIDWVLASYRRFPDAKS